MNNQSYPMQPGDVYQTYADTACLEEDWVVVPHFTLSDGIAEFMKWNKYYYK